MRRRSRPKSRAARARPGAVGQGFAPLHHSPNCHWRGHRRSGPGVPVCGAPRPGGAWRKLGASGRGGGKLRGVTRPLLAPLSSDPPRRRGEATTALALGAAKWRPSPAEERLGVVVEYLRLLLGG